MPGNELWWFISRLTAMFGPERVDRGAKSDSNNFGSENTGENNGYVLLFVSSAILVIYSLLFPLFLLFRSPPGAGRTYTEIVAFSPGLASFLGATIAFFGLAVFGLGIVGMAISRISYRKGERWAWYTLWYMVIFPVVGTIVDFSTSGSIAVTFIIVAILSTAGQLLSYPKFSQKQP